MKRVSINGIKIVVGTARECAKSYPHINPTSHLSLTAMHRGNREAAALAYHNDRWVWHYPSEGDKHYTGEPVNLGYLLRTSIKDAVLLALTQGEYSHQDEPVDVIVTYP